LTSDPQADLAAALRRPEPAAPLLALRHAADWAARTVLAGVQADPLTADTAALECVIALDDAFPAIAGLLSQLPELVLLAGAGAAVGDRLSASQAELTLQQAAVSAERGALKMARETLARLAEVEAERSRLQDEISRAREVALREREMPALRQTLAELNTALSAAEAADGDEVIRGLIAAGSRLTGLVGRQQSILEADCKHLVTTVAAATAAAAESLARRDELVAELAVREREASSLRAAAEEVLPALDARRRADAEFAAALLGDGTEDGTSSAALQRIQAVLAELGQRMTAAEQELGPLLRQHQRAYEENASVRGLNG
jgi:chromosome segregation ATPase